MIKQSKTTIKELTAQYRAVLKHAFFAGIAAFAVVSTANAEVSLDDVITSAEVPWAEVAEEADNPAEDTSGTYAYQKANGEGVNASGDIPTDTFGTKMEKTEYAVTSTAGTGASTGIASYEGTSGLSAATELVGEGDAATIAYSNYKYLSGNNQMIELGDSEAVFTENVDISAYTNVDGDTISVTGGVTEPTVAYDKFSFSSGTKTYTLVNDTTVNDGESDILIASISNETVRALATALSESHANAQAAVSDVQSDLNGYAATEATNYNIAKGVVAADTTLVKTAQTNYTGYETAYTNYHTAEDAYDAYAAYKTYAESLGKVIDVRSDDIVDAKVGDIRGKIMTMQSQQGNVEANLASSTAPVADHLEALADAIGDRTTLTGTNLKVADSVVANLNSLDSAIGDRSTLSGDYLTSDADIVTNLQSLNDGVEANADAIDTLNGDEGTAGSVKNSIKTLAKDADYDGTLTLSGAISANTSAINDLSQDMIAADTKLRNDIVVLDSKVNDLDENLSAGIASSVALSSVAVSNVKEGEMSVGGGYGNYNSKSAMAFGAALGITDNWSANAGVGVGFGKDTKASFRIGTNYKFKLF